jgi:hypothetical protein
MPKLPFQRGFYDDLRPFQKRDIKVRTEAFAPTRAQQLRTQFIWGLLLLAFLVAGFAARVYFAREEEHEVTRPTSMWKGVSVKPGGAASAPAGAPPPAERR